MMQARLSAAAAASDLSGGRKNKRKSLEPKRVMAPAETDDNINTAVPEKRPRLGSTGSSEERSPMHVASVSPGAASSHSDHSRSPSPIGGLGLNNNNSLSCKPPKMRFKEDAQRHQLQAEEQRRQQLKAAMPPKNPFRPWDDDSNSKESLSSGNGGIGVNIPAAALNANALLSRLQPALPTSFPFASPLMMPADLQATLASLYPSLLPMMPMPVIKPPSLPPPEQDEPLSLVKHDRSRDRDEAPSEVHKQQRSRHPKPLPARPQNLPPRPMPPRTVSPAASSSGTTSPGACGRGKQRNYKNMTRERRVEANARERQRVHTITAAFDTLQAAIPVEQEPTGANGQKLSKLSIIKIATSYIMVLSRMAGYDYSEDKSEPSVEDCVRKCQDLISAEAKLRKKGVASSDESSLE